MAASVLCFRKLIHWQYKDEFQAVASILKGVAESMKLCGSENKNSNSKRVLRNRFKELCYHLERGMRGREPLEISLL